MKFAYFIRFIVCLMFLATLQAGYGSGRTGASPPDFDPPKGSPEKDSERLEEDVPDAINEISSPDFHVPLG